MGERALGRTLALGAVILGVLGAEPARSGPSVSAPDSGPEHTAREELGVAFRVLGPGMARGLTVGPIESALHPNKGYGSAAFERTLREARRLGATWISLTPFGRIADLKATGIAHTFEQPFAENRRAVSRAIAQAHAQGLKVLLVPHLWVESGEWRGELAPGDDASWSSFARSYRDFVCAWAEVARDSRADLLAAGVELRTWVTTTRAPSFTDVVAELRRIYPGPLTYAANWDDADDTVVWGSLDVIGINGFYPLATRAGASDVDLADGAREVASRVRALSARWDKPVLFTEFGYTTRPDPALRPWEWPDHMQHVTVDQAAQARAYRALLGALLDEPRFIGAFAWRVYADPDDLSQEAEWGFSPRGKLAELVLRDAFAARWAADGASTPGAALSRHAAERVGVF